MARGLDRRFGYWCLLGASLVALALALAGCGVDEEAATSSGGSSVAIDGLYPAFDPGEPRYVSRCGRRAAPIRAEAGEGVRVQVGTAEPQAGEIQIDPGVGPGEDFQIAVIEDDVRRTYKVRCLPADFPKWRFETLRETAAPGLFALSLMAPRDARPWVVVFDHEGVPRWW